MWLPAYKQIGNKQNRSLLSCFENYTTTKSKSKILWKSVIVQSLKQPSGSQTSSSYEVGYYSSALPHFHSTLPTFFSKLGMATEDLGTMKNIWKEKAKLQMVKEFFLEIRASMFFIISAQHDFFLFIGQVTTLYFPFFLYPKGLPPLHIKVQVHITCLLIHCSQGLKSLICTEWREFCST